MRREKPALDAAGLAVVLIGLGTPTEAKAFQQALKLPFPILSDVDQRVYAKFGLGHISTRYGPAEWGQLVGDIARYGGAYSRNQDMSQLGGTIVVDQRGIVRFIHRSTRPTDNAQPSDVIAAIGLQP